MMSMSGSGWPGCGASAGRCVIRRSAGLERPVELREGRGSIEAGESRRERERECAPASRQVRRRGVERV